LAERLLADVDLCLLLVEAVTPTKDNALLRLNGINTSVKKA